MGQEIECSAVSFAKLSKVGLYINLPGILKEAVIPFYIYRESDKWENFCEVNNGRDLLETAYKGGIPYELSEVNFSGVGICKSGFLEVLKGDGAEHLFKVLNHFIKGSLSHLVKGKHSLLSLSYNSSQRNDFGGFEIVQGCEVLAIFDLLY